MNAFEFEGSAPNPSKIPPEDVMGVAALILTGSYKEQEFVRVGYYQNTEYDNEEMKEALPEPIRFDRLVRDINTKPRVTRFQIKWCVPLGGLPWPCGRPSLQVARDMGTCSSCVLVPTRDVAPPQANSAVAAGAANSAAVPSADDIGDDDEEPSVNGKPSS